MVFYNIVFNFKNSEDKIFIQDINQNLWNIHEH